MDEMDEVLEFFKRLSDVERLKIVGLLALQPRSMDEIATALQLRPAAVARQLERLGEINLVKQAGDRYELDQAALEARSRRVFAHARPRVKPEDFEGEDYDRKVLSDFMQPDGRIKALPMQQKKLLVILRYLAQSFAPGERYPEKQVNELLRRFHEDVASLRRYLVDYGLLQRERGEYWRI